MHLAAVISSGIRYIIAYTDTTRSRMNSPTATRSRHFDHESLLLTSVIDNEAEYGAFSSVNVSAFLLKVFVYCFTPLQ